MSLTTNSIITVCRFHILFAGEDKAEKSFKQLTESVENFLKLFQAHRFIINTSKTEFIVFSKTSKNAMHHL